MPVTVDPDEALKRIAVHAELSSLAVDAVTLQGDITIINRAVDGLKADLTALKAAEHLATVNHVTSRFKNIIVGILSNIPIPKAINKYLKILKDWTGIDLKKKMAEFNQFLDRQLDPQFNNIIDLTNLTITDGNTAFDKMIDVWRPLRGVRIIGRTDSLYRIWITPTVEFPNSVLDDPNGGLKPVLGW